ncbi:type II toxin-antitoxin system VapC family toxin [Syntrophorhabdus aromaticivorans]|uniref:type II toxin-antitoxin system VapC family toxin n=1 Tax=Syntrophorhabdus aromaticivorans TaxID=328301 RepID=UPI00048CF94E|nr:type II toxin-antitoxin system VapC family toxin [Syntrophorhabdus aromaticivorans]
MEYVVDASVILKWVLGDEKEPDQIKAMQLLNAWAAGDAAISAPTLWQYEVGNFLGREVPEEAKEKMGLLLDLKIRNVELSDNMYQLCFTWMREYRVSFYDASYLAVAYDIQATLVTADERFVRKLGKVDHLCVLREINP